MAAAACSTPVKAIILDFMMQFSPQSSASTDVGNALILSSYADKAGSYDFYDYPLFRTETINDEKVTKIVTKATINDPESSVIKDSSYRSDLNDGNGNGDRSETLLRKDTNSIGWSNNDQVIQEKMVQPKYTDEKYSKRSQTAASPRARVTPTNSFSSTRASTTPRPFCTSTRPSRTRCPTKATRRRPTST